MSDPFSQLEIKKEDLLETKESGIKKDKIPPHLIKISKGSIPSYISLNPYQTTAWKLMGKKATQKLEQEPDPKLEEDLLVLDA